MPKPRVCVLRAPGTNCDVETAYAFELCGAGSERVHLFRVLENPETLREFQVLCIPGGFSYGDDVGAGVIFANQLRGHLGDVVGEFLESDKLALGICNGFQVLLKSGILSGGSNGVAAGNKTESAATLTWNNNGKYTALWVRLSIAAPRNVFLRDMTELELPIAHAEGRLVVRDAAILTQWEQNGQIAVRYAPRQQASDGEGIESVRDPLPWPDNPNGSIANIAGLGDPTGRVLGLMPHPERFIHATQHPQWTRQGLTGEGAGLQIFRNAVSYFA